MSKPRARISRSEDRGKPLSALGELLWYLSADDRLEFIEPYLGMYRREAEDGRIHGAYGPRLFRMRDKINQVEKVSELLQEHPSSRRAVIQLFNAEDITRNYKDVPCTTTLQFHIRDNLLHLSVTLRSNDAYWGLPHDVFCFTMLQEMMACRLNVGLGTYYQYVGSMHIYEDRFEEARNYVHEGHQKIVEMPKMPIGDPCTAIQSVLRAEVDIRKGKVVRPSDFLSNTYWEDLIRLLQIFWALRRKDPIADLLDGFHESVYASLLTERQTRT